MDGKGWVLLCQMASMVLKKKNRGIRLCGARLSVRDRAGEGGEGMVKWSLGKVAMAGHEEEKKEEDRECGRRSWNL